MRVIAPQTVTDAVLVAASVPENDYPLWSAVTTYATGHRVVVAATHRIYESVADGNTGNNPLTTIGTKWIDLGPTNRWAMFDEAVGTLTTATGSLSVTLAPVRTSTVSVLDTDAQAVRVRLLVDGAAVADETRLAEASGNGRKTALFHDLPELDGALVEVTASAAGASESVAVGTLLIGKALDLGEAETAPTVGLTDYSKAETDDFGNTDIVERAWAKRLSIRTQIDNADLDATQRALAGLRARACLWIGEDGFDSLTIYGFYKDFSAEIGETGKDPDGRLTGKALCTLTIEGLTTAGTVATGGSGIETIFRNAPTQPETPASGQGVLPPGWTGTPTIMPTGYYRWQSVGSFVGGEQVGDWSAPVKIAGVNWADIIDDDAAHAKPEDGADVTGDHTAADTAAVGGKSSSTLLAEVAAVQSQADTIHSDLAAAVSDIGATTDALQAQAAAAAATITAQGGDIDTLQQLTATQGASIASNAQAISNAEGDLANFKVEVRANPANIFAQGNFDDGLSGFSSKSYPWSYFKNDAWWGNFVRINTAGGVNYYNKSTVYPFTSGQDISISCDIDRGVTTSGNVAVRIIWVDRNNANAFVSIGPSCYAGNGREFSNNENNRLKATGTCPLSANGYYIQLISEGASAGTNNYRRIKVARGTTTGRWTGEAGVTQVYTALSTTDLQVASVQSDLATANSAISTHQQAISGLQSSVATVSQRVTTAEASVETLSEAMTDVEGRTIAYLRNVASAGATQALLELVADGTWSGINLLADGIFLSNDTARAVLEIVGGQATFNGRLNALGGLVVSTDGRTTIDMTNGVTRYNDGNIDRVLIGNLDA